MKWTFNGPYKSCFCKKHFKDYNRALKLANKYNQRVYFCHICGTYHLTSQKEGG